ncbi:hypothetical protein BGX28_009689 [Mortierella sp. GBA30]|nr:hypothetical protein BGX28_009689 [Mortierella sp. GBA30]
MHNRLLKKKSQLASNTSVRVRVGSPGSPATSTASSIPVHSSRNNQTHRTIFTERTNLARPRDPSRYLPPAKKYDNTHLKGSPRPVKTHGLPSFEVKATPPNRQPSFNRGPSAFIESPRKSAQPAGYNPRPSLSDLVLSDSAPVSISSGDSSCGPTASPEESTAAKASVVDREPVIQPIQTFLRLRPSNGASEGNVDHRGHVDVLSNTDVLVNEPPKSRTKSATKYSFTKVLKQTASQSDVFEETCLPLLTPLLRQDNFNAVLLAYGVTGSGKTHSLIGSSELDGAGIIPRALAVVFRSIEAFVQNSGEAAQYRPVRFRDVEKVDPAGLGRASLSEKRYRKSIESFAAMESRFARFAKKMDLQTDGIGFETLLSKGDLDCGDKGTDPSTSHKYINGLKEIEVRTLDEAFLVLRAGLRQRQAHSTLTNEYSSRSHSIFTIKVLKTPQFGGSAAEDAAKGKTSVSRLSIVDVAGLERVEGTMSTGQRLKEAGNVNTSLRVLGHCLQVLIANQTTKNPQAVPFRHSKLTMLFQNALEGKSINNRVSLLVNCNPFESEFEDSAKALKFASAAMNISTSALKDDKQLSEKLFQELYEKIGLLERERAAMDESIRTAVLERLASELGKSIVDRLLDGEVQTQTTVIDNKAIQPEAMQDGPEFREDHIQKLIQMSTANKSTQTPATDTRELEAGPMQEEQAVVDHGNAFSEFSGKDDGSVLVAEMDSTEGNSLSDIDCLRRRLQDSEQKRLGLEQALDAAGRQNAAWQSWFSSAPTGTPPAHGSRVCNMSVPAPKAEALATTTTTILHPSAVTDHANFLVRRETDMQTVADVPQPMGTTCDAQDFVNEQTSPEDTDHTERDLQERVQNDVNTWSGDQEVAKETDHFADLTDQGKQVAMEVADVAIGTIDQDKCQEMVYEGSPPVLEQEPRSDAKTSLLPRELDTARDHDESMSDDANEIESLGVTAKFEAQIITIDDDDDDVVYVPREEVALQSSLIPSPTTARRRSVLIEIPPRSVSRRRSMSAARSRPLSEDDDICRQSRRSSESSVRIIEQAYPLGLDRQLQELALKPKGVESIAQEAEQAASAAADHVSSNGSMAEPSKQVDGVEGPITREVPPDVNPSTESDLQTLTEYWDPGTPRARSPSYSPFLGPGFGDPPDGRSDDDNEGDGLIPAQFSPLMKSNQLVDDHVDSESEDMSPERSPSLRKRLWSTARDEPGQDSSSLGSSPLLRRKDFNPFMVNSNARTSSLHHDNSVQDHVSVEREELAVQSPQTEQAEVDSAAEEASASSMPDMSKDVEATPRKRRRKLREKDTVMQEAIYELAGIPPPEATPRLLTKPAHSIINQSFDSRLRLDNRRPINGWYETEPDAELGSAPCIFTSVTPAWNNMNLIRLAEKIKSPLVFAHIKRKVQESLSDEIFLSVNGNTDSEWAFAVFLSQLKTPQQSEPFCHSALKEAMLKTIAKLNAWSRDAGITEASMMNFAVTDGVSVVCTRYISSRTLEAASLYYSSGTRFESCKPGHYRMVKADRREDIVVIASEPLTFEKADWLTIPTNTVVIITSKMNVLMYPIQDEFYNARINNREEDLSDVAVAVLKREARGNGAWDVNDGCEMVFVEDGPPPLTLEKTDPAAKRRRSSIIFSGSLVIGSDSGNSALSTPVSPSQASFRRLSSLLPSSPSATSLSSTVSSTHRNDLAAKSERDKDFARDNLDIQPLDLDEDIGKRSAGDHAEDKDDCDNEIEDDYRIFPVKTFSSGPMLIPKNADRSSIYH